MTKAEQFKSALKNLLEEYGASIDWECSPYSDTHGISGEHMCAFVDGKYITLCDGDSVSASDIED